MRWRRRRAVVVDPVEELVPLVGDSRSIEVDGVSASYGDEDVLHDLTFTVRPGRMLALTGPSGSGKSTLLWVLAGAHPTRAGEVRVGGVPVADYDESFAQGVLMLPQGSGLATMLTAYENVATPLMFAGFGPDAIERRTAAALAAVGLGEKGTHLVEELSGGQQQRVGMARLIALRSSVVLADEPTSELDAQNRHLVMGLLRRQADHGATVVVATHDPEAAEVADAELGLTEGHPTWVRR